MKNRPNLSLVSPEEPRRRVEGSLSPPPASAADLHTVASSGGSFPDEVGRDLTWEVEVALTRLELALARVLKEDTDG